MVKYYKPQKADESGFSIRIPWYAKRAGQYSCDVRDDGTLIYTPYPKKVNI
jgi:hypothetical protein